MNIRPTTVALLAAAVLASDVAAAVLCQARSNTVFRRERCRARERVVSLETFGLNPPGPSGPSGPRGETGTIPFRLLDRDGRPVGVLTALDANYAYVVVTGPPFVEPVELIAELFGFLTAQVVSYVEPACAGTPFLPFDLPGPVPFFVAQGRRQGQTIFYTSGPPELITPLSESFIPDGSCPAQSTALEDDRCCRASSTTPADRVPAKTAPLDALGFAVPFKVVPR